MRIWLCPVTEYVFGGSYPREIYVRVVDLNENNLSSEIRFNSN
jgi:hypothetical protein